MKAQVSERWVLIHGQLGESHAQIDNNLGLGGDGSKPWYLVNPKIAGKWMFIPLKMVLIGIDPYPGDHFTAKSKVCLNGLNPLPPSTSDLVF